MICGYKKKLNAKLFFIILATSPENVAEKE